MATRGDEDVVTYVLPDDGRQVWFYVCRRFKTDAGSLLAFNHMNEYAARLKGEAQIAGYRLLDALPEDGGQPTIVVVTGQIEERVREAARSMEGETWPLDPRHMRGLVLRRLRFLAAGQALGAPSGVHVFRHGKGMWLDNQGNVIPPAEG